MKLGRAALRRLPNPTLTLVLVDGLTAFAAFYLAAGLRFGFDLEASRQSVGPLFPRGLTFAIWIIAGLLSMGLYRPRQRPTTAETIVRVILGVALGSVGNILFVYAVPSLTFGRGVLVIGLVISSLMLLGIRLGALKILDANPMKRRVLVIGAGQAAAKVRRLRRRSDRRRFEVIAFVAMSELERTHAGKFGFEVVTSLEESRALPQVDEIVVALDDQRGNLPLDFLLEQKQRGVAVSDIVDFLERETERLDLDILRPSWLLYEKSSQTDLVYRWFKRLFDLLSSTALLIVCLPVLLVIVVAIWVEDGIGAPVFYRQTRVGRNGTIFRLLKFRSMRVDAERNSGPQFSRAGDDRITRVGHLIRRFRLDELPQVINVIMGDMSVVGPRPERPTFVEELSRQLPLYFYRHGVRPGLTGWAQLNFPYGESVDDARDKLTYDLYYIKNTNIVTDFLILMQTLEVVVWGRGTSMSGSSALRPGSPPSDKGPQGVPLIDPRNREKT